MDQSQATETPPKLSVGKSVPAPGRFRPGRVFCRWWWLVAVVMIAITAVAYKIPDWFNMRGPLYESTVLLEIKPMSGFTTSAPTTTTHRTTAPMPSRSFATQREIIHARATLELAMKKSDLLNRLGGNQTEVLHRLQRSLTVRQRRGTDLIEISYRDEDPQLAKDAVTAIYQSYTDRRTELERQLRENEIKALETELQSRSKKTAELRSQLKKIAEKSGIIFNDAGSPEMTGKLDLISKAEKELYEAQREKEQLKFQIEKLLELDGLEGSVPLWSPEDSNISLEKLRKQYEKEREKLNELRAAGLGKEHPDIRAREGIVKGYEKELMRRKGELTRESLKLKLAAVEARVKKLKQVINTESDRATAPARSIKKFNIARKEYQAAQSASDQLQVKRDITKVKLNMPATNHILHQHPERPTMPVTRGRDFFTTLFTLLAIPLAAIASIALIYLAEVIFPRRVEASYE